MRWFYLLFAITMLIASWESGKTDALAAETNAIPDQSIRLRIIANSDSPADQALKRRVRDSVVKQISTWVGNMENLDQARNIIQANLPELRSIVQKEIQESGFSYRSTTELAVVPFPTKMYGGRVYPAGEYEALRISIGEAKGQNWWCVLFPPLCFVDFTNTASTEVGSRDKAVKPASVTAASANISEDKVEIGFFLWEWFLQLKQWILG